MTDFNLNELIASCSEAGPDPDDWAAKVEPLIPESHRPAVFLMLLARYIVSAKPRLSHVIQHPAAVQDSKPHRSSAKSAKVAAYQRHAEFLRLNVNVGQGQRKWLENCTYEDLLAAAAIRRTQAIAINAAAEDYSALAALVKEHGVATVGALPPAVLDAFMASRRRAA